MVEPMSADNVPADFNSPRPDLEFIIEKINELLQKDIDSKRWNIGYSNKDGTRDKFRCIICFEGNEYKNDEDLHAWCIWKEYHTELMNAYRKAGWIVREWFPGHHRYSPYSSSPVPQYCLSLLQESIADVLDEMQDKVKNVPDG